MLRPCALLSVLLVSCSTLSTESPQAARAPNFPDAIARIERADPHSPALLSARLSYAEFLVGADTQPCQPRLDLARAQFDRVAANPQLAIMFPDGWARLADLEYQLHIARAECLGAQGGDAEQRAALESARRTEALYRQSFDYRAAVVMHYNRAVLLHQLGESGDLQALEETLAMDREFGFADDARENYPLLLTWQGRPADDAHVAALMQDFPKRQAQLKFAWHAGDARITIEDDRDSLWGSGISRSRAAATYLRRIVARAGGGWTVSYTPVPGQYRPGVWPSAAGAQTGTTVFAPARLAAPDFQVGADGAFGGTLGAEAYSAQLIAQTDELIRAGAPATADAAERTREALQTVDVAFSSGLLVAQAAEEYQLQTSMWAGAMLDQGIWYRLEAPLSLHGLPRLVVQQQLEFAFTRLVPCTADAPEPACVELVVRTTPDEAAVARIIKHYASSSATRFVMDPKTLLTYSREERLYWYGSVGDGPRDNILQSEHLIATTAYAAH